MNTVAQKPMYTEKRAFFVLTCMCIVLFTLYVYFISASVVHVVIRTETNQDISKISSEISALESKYIEAQLKVSSDIASLQGYQKAEKKIFIDRGTDSLVLRTNLDQ